MLLVRMILGMLIVSCLSSCVNPNSYPRIKDQEQLSPFLAPAVEIEGKLYIPVKKSVCLSRVYRISKGFVGSIGRELDLDIYECNKIIGRAPAEYGVFATWLENFRNWLLKFNRKKRRR